MLYNEADGKFRSMQAEICAPLFEMLREINALEKEFSERSGNMVKQFGQGVAPSFAAAEWDKLWREYHERYESVVSDKCTEKLLSRGFADRMGNPQKYGYIDNDCKVFFFMKAPSKATVEIHFMLGSSLHAKHQFKLIRTNGRWLLNSFEFDTEEDNIWHRGNI